MGFKVKCDKTNNSKEDQDQGRINVEIELSGEDAKDYIASSQPKSFTVEGMDIENYKEKGYHSKSVMRRIENCEQAKKRRTKIYNK